MGDGNLAKSPETQRIAALAVFESRQQIFKARATKESPNIDDAEKFFPNMDTIKHANWHALGYILTPTGARCGSANLARSRCGSLALE